jgi:hypothetical protein
LLQLHALSRLLAHRRSEASPRVAAAALGLEQRDFELPQQQLGLALGILDDAARDKCVPRIEINRLA